MSKVLTIPISALFLIGCANVTPPHVATTAPTFAPQPSPIATNTEAARVTPISAETPTPIATAPVLDPATLFNDVAAQLKTYQPPDTDPTILHAALTQAASEFLRANADPDKSLEGQSALDSLKTALGKLSLPQDVKPNVAAIHLRDSEGGSEDLALISLEKMPGLPVIALHRLGSSYDAIPFNVITGNVDLKNNFWSGSASGADLTGDGVGEAIYTYQVSGASALTTVLNVQRWVEETKELKTIFRASLVNWAGESTYGFVPASNARRDIQLTFPWFGVFDQKLLEHLRATQVWTYVSALDKFVKDSQTVEPAKTARQQVNGAENFLRHGELENAGAAFDAAWNDQSLANEDSVKADFRGFARFREGEVLALLGRDKDARTAVNEAQKRGGTLAKLAAAFLQNYSGTDGALRAWAALPSSVDLYQLLYQDEADNLGFPLEAREVFFKGQVLASYLDTHPDAAAQPDQVFIAVNALGLKTLSSNVIDLDGDGTNEFLFVTQEGGSSPNQAQDLWMVYNRDDHWAARIIFQSDTVTLEDATPLAKGNAVRIKLSPNFEPSEQALTWNQTRVIFLQLPSLQPRPDQSEWPSVGDGKLDDDF
jgi:hypothetical protein